MRIKLIIKALWSSLFLITLFGCSSDHSEKKQSDQSGALKEIRNKVLSDTLFQLKEDELMAQLNDPFVSQVDSLNDYLVFMNTDLVNYTDSYFKDKQEWGAFAYPTLNELMTVYDTVKVENRNYFMVEGDILLTYSEIFPYHLGVQSYMTDTSRFQSQKLVGEIRNGNYVRQEYPRNMKYAIIKETFTDEEYDTVSKVMKKAVNDWKSVCNIDMEHLAALDETLSSSSNPEALSFVIKKVDVLGDFIANAFFPYSPKYRRKLLIDQTFFDTDFSQAGVLRHEIGHILGFLHEHIHSRASPICPVEPRGGAIDLTKYDPKSVMHYFCDTVGTKTLLITKMDSIGASLYYPF